MRITSGILKNRKFLVPKQDVRPTKESVREAVFSSLGGRCDQLDVLDLCAGAGGLGLEAWSRGAASVTFVELSSVVCRNLQKNIDNLSNDELGEVLCVKADAFRYLERARSRGRQFDLILADPPYELEDALNKTLDGIRSAGVLKVEGTLVYELRSRQRFELPEGWDLIREKKYGESRVLMLRLQQEEGSHE